MFNRTLLGRLQQLRLALRQPRGDDARTFANIRIRILMTPEIEGGYTRDIPVGEQMPIYDAAMQYQASGTSLVVIADKEGSLSYTS